MCVCVFACVCVRARVCVRVMFRQPCAHLCGSVARRGHMRTDSVCWVVICIDG